MVIDLEISHPSDGGGWRVVSLRVERVDPEHLAASGGGGMDVDPAETGPRLLTRASEVLRRYLERYLDAVNAYDEAERNWQDAEEEDGETMELRAERAVLAFGEQLRDLRAIDLQMKPLDAGEMDVDGAREERVLWDQLDDLHDFVRYVTRFLPVYDAETSSGQHQDWISANQRSYRRSVPFHGKHSSRTRSVGSSDPTQPPPRPSLPDQTRTQAGRCRSTSRYRSARASLDPNPRRASQQGKRRWTNCWA